LRVSLNWLRDFVDIEITPEELAERLALAGLPVEGIEYPGKEIEKVFTGKIVKIDPHPNADKLVICQVVLGEGDPLTIVTGAPNVEENQIIALAVERARLPGGFTIKKTKLRGVESRGMLCSWQELGVDSKFIPAEQAHGIMVLPPDTPLGVDLKPLVGLDDVILEVEVTPNRGDCLSMLGIAREVAAILNQPLRYNPPEVTELAQDIAGMAQVDILNPGLCHRYVARLFTNVKIAPSPLWMQARLRASGVRPISNIVDITNYVMMEMGQPLHAFDYDKLKDRHIIVRTAREEEVLVSLDGVTRQLTPDMLIITDPSGPVAVAGIMGGLDTEITQETVNILLEAAYFNPVTIRRTSKALGLRSEASLRFEKSIDKEGCLAAANRSAQLLQQIGAGEIIRGVIDNYPVPREAEKILLRPARVNFVLGTDLTKEDIASVLNRLHFEVGETGEDLVVGAPSYRSDVSTEIDLIEEVARLHGYNQIRGTLPSGVTSVGILSRERVFEDQVKETLTGCGLTEVVTFSFAHPDVGDLFNLPAESPQRKMVKIKNPLSEEYGFMRTWLLPALVDILRRNFSRRVTSGTIFEMGRVFFPRPEGEQSFSSGEELAQGRDRLPEERSMLAAAGMGEIPGGWNGKGTRIDYYFFKGVLEALLGRLNIDNISFVPEEEHPTFHPGRTARVLAGGVELGILGEMHPDILERLELPQRVVGFELDSARVLECAREIKDYSPLPRFPSVQRDIAVLAPKDISAQKLVETIKKAGGELLRSVYLFDAYEGEQVKKGYRSLAFALKFLAGDRTLTVEEINSIMEKMDEKLMREAGAEIRRDK